MNVTILVDKKKESDGIFLANELVQSIAKIKFVPILKQIVQNKLRPLEQINVNKYIKY